MMTALPTERSTQTLAKALNFVLDHERQTWPCGGSNGFVKEESANDEYLAYRREYGLPSRSITPQSSIEELAIYMEHYAEPIHVADLPYPIALVLFDSAVNVGTGRVVIWLQAVLGIMQDGGFGPKTLTATKTYIARHGANALAGEILARRVAYYMSIGSPGKPLYKFLKEWLNRVADLRKEIGLAH